MVNGLTSPQDSKIQHQKVWGQHQKQPLWTITTIVVNSWQKNTQKQTQVQSDLDPAYGVPQTLYAIAEVVSTKYQKQMGQSNLGYGIWHSASCTGKAPEAFAVGQPIHHQHHHLIYVSQAIGDQAVLISPKLEEEEPKSNMMKGARFFLGPLFSQVIYSDKEEDVHHSYMK